jgi:hypothetical protein
MEYKEHNNILDEFMDKIEEKVVLFIDLLGFAQLVEKYTLDVNAFRRFQSPLSSDIMQLVDDSQHPLTHAFTIFHHTLKWAIEHAQMQHALTAITFSDSAFFVTNKLYESVNVAISITQSLVQANIPVRMGIAIGSFSALRFRSDISLSGGDHSAHFLGTGVTRAFKTESCGIKGIRILLHPSTLSLIDNQYHLPSDGQGSYHLECSKDELNNEVGVHSEINYWKFKTTQEVKVLHAFNDMWNRAPIPELIHYEATARAIVAMRESFGKKTKIDYNKRRLVQGKNI